MSTDTSRGSNPLKVVPMEKLPSPQGCIPGAAPILGPTPHPRHGGDVGAVLKS